MRLRWRVLLVILGALLFASLLTVLFPDPNFPGDFDDSLRRLEIETFKMQEQVQELEMIQRGLEENTR